jgi:hypothetical protein
MISKPQYLWIHKKNPENHVLSIVEDPIEIFKTGQIDPRIDKFFMIGQEVEIEVSLKQVPAKRSVENMIKDDNGRV